MVFNNNSNNNNNNNNNTNNNSAYLPTSRFHFASRFSIGLYTKFFGGILPIPGFFPTPS